MKRTTKTMIGLGIFCVLLTAASTWYAVKFNDSRLVVPMDYSGYKFQARDLPMILSVSLTCIYIIALFITLMIRGVKRRMQNERTHTTRTINPKLGFLGLLGFCGFAGFLTYRCEGVVFPFAFFTFFGFFGFFYEGKMSGTFMDERFRENAVLAQLKSCKIALAIIFIAMIILCQGRLFGSLEHTLIAIIIVVSLALALEIFLSEYLLYRYDHGGQEEDGGE